MLQVNYKFCCLHIFLLLLLTVYRTVLHMSNSFFKLSTACSLELEAFISFYQAAILAKERRQTWSNIVATLRIVAYVQGNVRDRFGRLVGQYVISRSYLAVAIALISPEYPPAS